jgi:AcrR family transcriptional regulator
MFGRKKKHIIEVDSRELLLRTAEELFAMHGFDGVSTRMIQKKCGLNIALIAYYFGSKEGLFKAILEERFPVIRERLEIIKEEKISNWEKLNKTIDVYVEKLFEQVLFSKIVFRELSMSQRQEQNELILHYIYPNTLIIKSFFLNGIENKEFRKVDIELTITSIFSIIIQWINVSALTERLIDVSKREDLYNAENKLRLKNYLKDLMFRHLKIEN